MDLFHTKLGYLIYDEYSKYIMEKKLLFCGKEYHIDIYFNGYYYNEDITAFHCTTYDAIISNWDTIQSTVIEKIILFQNDEWDASDHTMSFKKFETTNDVLDHTKFYGITIQTENINEHDIVLEFNADWVNDDYRILSVHLMNEEVVEVTDQAISS